MTLLGLLGHDRSDTTGRNDVAIKRLDACRSRRSSKAFAKIDSIVLTVPTALRAAERVLRAVERVSIAFERASIAVERVLRAFNSFNTLVDNSRYS